MSLIIGRGTANEWESLERSIACFWVALREASSGYVPARELQSFAWIAAVACLQELDKLQRTMPLS
jgi:hypothetical protein